MNGTVDLLSAASLSTPGDTVIALVEKTTEDLIKKKDIISKAGQSAALVNSLRTQKAATAAFTNAVDAKLPDIARTISGSTNQRPITALDKGIAAFT